mmetsp:Transcript_52833/g.123469  ORF Transcript_52833/g.123469 Transcript_52833/m.123469 type:complete len:167 (+) Transcript_52833:2-502(+)
MTHAEAATFFGPILVVAGLISVPLGGWVGDRFRHYKGGLLLVSGLALLLAAPCSLFQIWAPFPYAWAFVFFVCFWSFFTTGPTNAAMCNVVVPKMRPGAFAVSIFVQHALGDAISPPLIGVINDKAHGNMNLGFGAVGVVMFLSAFSYLAGRHYLDDDSAKIVHLI